MNPRSSIRSASSSTKCAHFVEPEMPRAHQVTDAARRADHDVGAALHPLLLRAAADAPQHDRRGEALPGGETADGGFDLQGELTGRSKDQRARRERPGAVRHAGQVLQDRQPEGGGLAAAGLGDAEQVAPGQQWRMAAAWIGVGVRSRRRRARATVARPGRARRNRVRIMSRWSSARPCGIDARWLCSVVRQPHVTTGGPIADEMSREGQPANATGANYVPGASARSLHRRFGAETQAPSRRVRAG